MYLGMYSFILIWYTQLKFTPKKNCLLFEVNTIFVDDLGTQGARASVGITVKQFTWPILYPVEAGLMHYMPKSLYRLLTF